MRVALSLIVIINRTTIKELGSIAEMFYPFLFLA